MSEAPSSHYLLAIAIGPVQEFIAASRKARDLWAGSSLLSRLCRAAAMCLKDQPGVTVVFPSKESLDRGHAVANKILVSVAEGAMPEEVAEAARNAVKDELEEAWNDLSCRATQAKVDRDLAERQLAEFVEWYAAWWPYDPSVPSDVDDPGSYGGARIQLERLLAGRKALRDFWPASLPQAISWTERVPSYERRPKSSLDPARESIVTTEGLHDADVRRALHLRLDEPLDTISVIKRLTGTSWRRAADASDQVRESDTTNPPVARFPSTSRIAIDPFIRAIASTVTTRMHSLGTLGAAMCGIATSETDFAESLDVGDAEACSRLAQFRAFPYDSQLLYAESSDAVIRRQEKAWPVCDGLKGAVTSFIDQVKDIRTHIDYGELPAYYAILVADGDRMGQTLSYLQSADDHAKFSTALGEFAAKVDRIVASYQGASIYSGGDDVLAFLPLDAAIPCADRLRREFRHTMEQALSEKQGRDGLALPIPTLSVGLAIGHYAEHLKVMLDRAREAERMAKRGGKNALAVSFSAHSGGGDERTVVHSWQDEPLRNRWGWAINLHRYDLFPDRGAYQLDAVYREFRDATRRTSQVFVFEPTGSTQDEAFARDVLIKETLRVLGRKQARAGTKSTQQMLLEQIKVRLNATTNLKDALQELQNVITELLIARRIARLLPADGVSKEQDKWWSDGDKPDNRILQPPVPDETPAMIGEGAA